MLTGHVDFDSAYFSDPDGTDKRRKKKRVWIESNPLLGDRIATLTFHSKTNKPNKTTYSSYATVIYLYIDKQGHLRSKRYFFKDEDAAANKRKFQKLVTEIDTSQLADTQQFNIRIDMMTAFKADCSRQLVKLKGPLVDHFTQWRNDVLYFLHSCPFFLMGNYPDLPAYTEPDPSTNED